MRDFEESQWVHDQTEKVLKLLRGKRRTEVLTHDEIVKATSCVYPSNAYRHIVRKARAQFEETDHVATLAVPGVGYRLLTHEEQIGELPRRGKRARRQIHRGVNSVSRLPAEEIDGDLYRIWAATLNHAHLMAETMEAQARTATRLLRRPVPLPRPHDDLVHAG